MALLDTSAETAHSIPEVITTVATTKVGTLPHEFPRGVRDELY